MLHLLRTRNFDQIRPATVIVDSQSVKATESGSMRGYDAGKKVKRRKQHAMVDTHGRALKL